MQHIHELIGLLKGVNYDGIINDREVIRLQAWVDNNRNLVFDNQQMKLIKMLESILADRVIDEDEKIMILSACEDYLNGSEDNSVRMYELNGIIEGIVCDGVINESEVMHLLDWMELYGKSLKEYIPSEELCRVIDRILEDGIVTEEEQAELLNMLGDRIKFNQFENKLAYLSRLVKEKKNIGTDLIDILNNKSAMNEIHTRAEDNLYKAVSNYNDLYIDKEIIIVSLVLIAMLEYNGSYYDSVRDTYKTLYESFSEQKVEGKIRSILSQYKMQSDSGTRTRIINVVLENAIVPQAFLPAFFEFIYDIYKLNFEFDLPSEPYEDFRFVYEGLRNNLLSDGDDISIKVTQKTYKLIATTKQLISREDGLDAVIKLSIIIVKLIDQRIWQKDVKIFNSYLRSGFEGWEKTLKGSERERNTLIKSTAELRSRWEPKFILLDNEVYLYPPAHRVKSQYDYRDIEVVVVNDGEEIYRNNRCDIREIIGGYQIHPDRIEIRRPLGKLTYRLMAGHEVIYDSREKLHRNFLVFNDNGEEIKNNSDYEGAVSIVYKEGEAKLEHSLTKENYSLGHKLVRVGDAIEISGDLFNFSSMAKPGIFGSLYQNCGVQKDHEETMIPVYHGNCYVVFEADHASEKFVIEINGKPYKLSDMQYKSTLRATSTKYVVELGLKESGVYKIVVNQLSAGSKNKILQSMMVYDEGLTYSKHRLEDSVFRVQVSSRLLPYHLDVEVRADGFNPQFIRFDYEGSQYTYYLPWDFGFYQLSGSEWLSQSNDLWVGDIQNKSILTLFDSECDGFLLHNESGVLVESDINLIDGGYYKQLPIFFLTSYKNSNSYVTLMFTANGKLKHAIRCYNKNMMDKEKTEIVFNNETKKAKITPIFHGKNKVYYDLLNLEGEKILTSKLLESGQTSTISKVKSFREYTFQFYEKTDALLLQKSRMLLEKNRTFYAKEDLVGRSYKIIEAFFNQLIQGKFVEKQWFFNKYFVKLARVISLEEGIFEGDIYSESYNGKFYLYNINPVEVRLCSDVIDGTMDIYMSNEGDGLLFDPQYKGIMNSMDHPTAPDIFLYTIRMNGEEK